MALRPKVLQKKAEKFELKKLQVLTVTKERLSPFDALLQDVYADRRPKPTEYEVRRDLIRVFNEIAKEIYGNSKNIPVVVEFGSFVMDLFSNTSDLDLSVNFSTSSAVAFPREKKIQTLRKFAKKLYAIQSKGHVSGVLPITTAKVPILKCVDRGTGVECDISVENRDGILKSQIIHIISSIDERFQKLSFLMKTWAKAHNINSSKDKTLNSLSIILLVAFHLQTRNPPILPPFSAIFKGGTDPATVVKSMSNFVNYGKRNEESLAELFVTLLIKLSSVEKLWAKGLCASTCNASWTSKTWSDSKVAPFSVEDFTDGSQNVARAVGQAEVKKIYKCIEISIQHIFSFMDGRIGVEVRDLLFGQDGNRNPIPIQRGPRIPPQPNRAVNGKRKKQTMSFESTKRQQHSVAGWAQLQPNPGGWEGTQQLSAGGWEVTQQPSAGGWAGTQQRSAGGWEVTQQSNARGWGTTQQTSPGGWGVTQQTSTGGWGVTQQTSTGGWGVTQQTSTGGWGVSQQTSTGGWGVAQQLSAVAWEVTQQLSGGGWEETQNHNAGGWGGTSNPHWRTNPYRRR